MDILPADITPRILTHYQNYLREINLTADFHLIRSVCKEWDKCVCQLTTKLPVKFWFWLGRKSLVDCDVFIPISYHNLRRIQLFERFQVIKLIQSIEYFKNLEFVDLASVESLYPLDFLRLTKLSVPHITGKDYQIINQQKYGKYDIVGIQKYFTDTSSYIFPIKALDDDIESDEENYTMSEYEVHFKNIISTIKTDYVRKITITSLAEHIDNTHLIIHILRKCVSMFKNVTKFKITGTYSNTTNITQQMNSEPHLYSNIKSIKCDNAYISRHVTYVPDNSVNSVDIIDPINSDNTTLTVSNLLNISKRFKRSNMFERFKRKYGDNYSILNEMIHNYRQNHFSPLRKELYVNWNSIYKFMTEHNLFNVYWLDNINTVTVSVNDKLNIDMYIKIIKIFKGHLVLNIKFNTIKNESDDDDVVPGMIYTVNKLKMLLDIKDTIDTIDTRYSDSDIIQTGELIYVLSELTFDLTMMSFVSCILIILYYPHIFSNNPHIKSVNINFEMECDDGLGCQTIHTIQIKNQEILKNLKLIREHYYIKMSSDTSNHEMIDCSDDRFLVNENIENRQRKINITHNSSYKLIRRSN